MGQMCRSSARYELLRSLLTYTELPHIFEKKTNHTTLHRIEIRSGGAPSPPRITGHLHKSLEKLVVELVHEQGASLRDAFEADSIITLTLIRRICFHRDTTS